jgi:hypothetical protein
VFAPIGNHQIKITMFVILPSHFLAGESFIEVGTIDIKKRLHVKKKIATTTTKKNE